MDPLTPAAASTSFPGELLKATVPGKESGSPAVAPATDADRVSAQAHSNRGRRQSRAPMRRLLRGAFLALTALGGHRVYLGPRMIAAAPDGLPAHMPEPMYPRVATAPHLYLRDYRTETPDNRSSYNYGALRVDRACAEDLEDLVTQMDDPEFLATIDQAMRGDQPAWIDASMSVVCPMPADEFGSGNYIQHQNRVGYSVLRDSSRLFFDENATFHSNHRVLVHEFSHARAAQTRPSTYAFSMEIPSADHWPNVEELRVQREAEHPFAARFALVPKAGYTEDRSIPYTADRNLAGQKARERLAEFPTTMKELTPQQLRAAPLGGWQPPDEERVRVRFLFNAGANITPELAERVIRHIVSAQAKSDEVVRGIAPRSDLAAFDAETAELRAELEKHDRLLPWHGCAKADAAPPEESFEHEIERMWQEIEPTEPVTTQHPEQSRRPDLRGFVNNVHTVGTDASYGGPASAGMCALEDDARPIPIPGQIPPEPGMDYYRVRIDRSRRWHHIAVPANFEPTAAVWRAARTFAHLGYGPRVVAMGDRLTGFFTLAADEHRLLYTAQHVQFATAEHVCSAVENGLRNHGSYAGFPVKLVLDADSLWRTEISDIVDLVKSVPRELYGDVLQAVIVIRDKMWTEHDLT